MHNLTLGFCSCPQHLVRSSVLKTIARPSISHCKFAKLDFAATSSRHSHDHRTTVVRHSRDSLAKYFGAKIRIKFLNMFKNFATSSRLVRDTSVKILTTLVRHLHECRAKFRDKIRKTVARNSHASEILALSNDRRMMQ